MLDTLISRRPPEWGGWSAPRATFGFASNKAGATFCCSLDEGPYELCTSPKTYTGLSHGTHVFKVRSKSVTGEVDPSPATHRWKVDARKPTISEVRPRPGVTTTDRTPRISAVAGDAHSGTYPYYDDHIRLYIDGEEAGSVDYERAPEGLVGYRLVYRYAEGERLSLGEHTVRVVARDRVGNVARESWSFTITR